MFKLLYIRIKNIILHGGFPFQFLLKIIGIGYFNDNYSSFYALISLLHILQTFISTPNVLVYL